MESITRKILTLCFSLVVLASVILLFFSFGEKAIRANNITDPILKPVVTQFADAVDANPGLPKPRMDLGMTYEGAGLNELAELTYDQYIRLFPKRVIGWYRHAVVSHHQGKVSQAISSLEQAAQLAPPEMDSPHWQLALWYIDVGDIEKAKKQIDIANAKKPNSIQLQIAKARLAMEEKNFDLAISILENQSLIAKVPDGYVYQLLGRAYRAVGEVEQSKLAWSRAGNSKPKWADPWTQTVISHIGGLKAERQQIVKQMSMNNIREARALINQYLTIDAENRVARRLDALCSAREGNAVIAMEIFTELLKEEPNDTVTMLLLAKLRLQIVQFQDSGGIQQTRELLLKILEITPDNDQAIQLLEDIDNR